ncbi:reverse transcriptase zinc-binding domain-containing protein [Artemisia annua]|uniref:Reverse transcriptase zinc-binding domain-containing protein n=1 Tax=Artemisia annua TaxID=35608 RepID=A0A2U1KEN9_ARTAN|nr:reverse transcriptase zinc-binding domain-containing protein [Artemisia annua]
MAWIAWKKVCIPSNYGGLGVGSLQASNLAMLVKWWWRFKMEDNTHRKNIVVSIHRDKGGLYIDDTTYNRLPPSPSRYLDFVRSSRV